MNKDISRNIGILFDYNGVIVDDEILQEQAFAAVLNDEGIELTHQMYSNLCMGRTDSEGFAELKKEFLTGLEQYGIKELANRKTEKYFELAPQTSVLFEGAGECIKRLSDDFLLGIVTSSSIREFEVVMKKTNLLRYFSSILTAEDFQKGKPDPEPYNKGLQSLGTLADMTVAIEDSVSGVKAAKSAGLKCIAVLHTNSYDRLASADKIVQTLQDITTDLIRSIIGEKIDNSM